MFQTPRPATQFALIDAIEQVIQSDFSGKRPHIILFGGAGYIGSDLADALRAQGDAPQIIDLKEPGEAAETCLDRFRGEPTLVVDVARRNAIAAYVPNFWPENVLLNETYPEPTGKLLAALQACGVRAKHVSRINGQLRPSLPDGYAGAVPCCVAHRLGQSSYAVLKTL